MGAMLEIRPLVRLTRTCFLAAALAASATSQEVTFPDGKPADILRDDAEAPVRAIVAAEGAPVLSAPDKYGDVIAKEAYLSSYYVAGRAKDGERSFTLLAEVDEVTMKPTAFKGWVRDEDLLSSLFPLKAERGIYRKALVVNYWKEVESGGLEIKGAPYFDGPGTIRGTEGDPHAELGVLGLFKFYFVYKAYSPNAGKEYLLIGSRPVISPSRPEDTLLGWIERERVYLWDTRQAVEFDKTTLEERKEGRDLSQVGAQVYERREELEAYLKGKSSFKGVKLEPVALEDPEVGSWPASLQRFPLFDVVQSSAHPKAGSSYEIGYIGDQINSEGLRFDSKDTAEAQRKLEAMREDLSKLDLLFVIDSTGSMAPYMEAAARAVETIANEVTRNASKKLEGLKIRYSVLFYRDYGDEDGVPPDTYLVKRCRLTQNRDEIVDFLKREEAGGGGDALEAVFFAIDSAIASAVEEVHDSGFRAVVLIGDSGNHVTDPRGYTVEATANRLKEANYDFYAINVAGTTDSTHPAGILQSQVDSILRSDPRFSGEQRGVRSNDPSDVARLIVDFTREQIDLAVAAKKFTGEVSGGRGIVELKREYGLVLTNRLTQMMTERGIDPAMFVENSIQIFGKGWVSQNDPVVGIPQIREVLLIDRGAFERLTAMLSGMLSDAASPEAVQKTWMKVLKDNLGEADSEKSVKELVYAHLGIPIRSNILSKSLSEIAGMTPSELDEIWLNLEVHLYRLRGIIEQKKQDVSIQTNEAGQRYVHVDNLGSRTVWWKEGGIEYGWIPIEELP